MGLYYLCGENKGAGQMHLWAKSRFSHDMAHLISAFVLSCLVSVIPLSSYIQNFERLVSLYECAGWLYSTRSESQLIAIFP